MDARPYFSLKLKTNAIEARFEQPADQFDRRDLSENAAHQALKAVVEPVLANSTLRPIPVASTGDHELDLIGRLEHIEIHPAIAMALAAIGAFQIENDVHARIDRGDIVHPLVSR